MLNKIILTFLSVCLLYGCQASDKSPTVINIGHSNITLHEFETAFNNSPYAVEDSKLSRKDFLDIYLVRIMILKQAEKTGMDKDPEFLKDVESFWQQSLIKMVLDKKIKEISAGLKVDDKEIEDYYKTHKVEFVNQELAAVRDDIKWVLLNNKQKDAMASWVDSVKKSSKVDINYKLLNIDK